MNTSDIKKLYDQYLLGNYAPADLCLVKGKGSWVWDVHGKRYLDFFPGWAVSGLGHCHPKVVDAIRDQARKIIHIPNNFLNLKQAKLAEVISEASFPSKLFFCNSGAEAVEAAIKFARKWGNPQGKHEIITMKRSFHGRTYGAMTATGQKKFHDGFEPLPKGFKYAEFNDYASLEKLVSAKTAAIMLEPVQGEGGVRIAGKPYLKKIRQLCNKKKILLILDEVQTGMGRTGKMFAYEHYGILPDLMTLAKSLGGGVPIGALVVHNKIKNVLVPGTHASTFGGNPLVCAAALAVFKVIRKEKMAKRAAEMGEYFVAGLEKLKESYPVIRELRALGLMIGLELDCEGAVYVSKAREKGLLINCTQGNVLRIIPAMTTTKKEIDFSLGILNQVFAGEKNA